MPDDRGVREEEQRLGHQRQERRHGEPEDLAVVRVAHRAILQPSVVTMGAAAPGANPRGQPATIGRPTTAATQSAVPSPCSTPRSARTASAGWSWAGWRWRRPSCAVLDPGVACWRRRRARAPGPRRRAVGQRRGGLGTRVVPGRTRVGPGLDIASYVACLVVAARALMPCYRVRLLRTKGASLVTVAVGGRRCPRPRRERLPGAGHRVRLAVAARDGPSSSHRSSRSPSSSC